MGVTCVPARRIIARQVSVCSRASRLIGSIEVDLAAGEARDKIHSSYQSSSGNKIMCASGRSAARLASRLAQKALVVSQSEARKLRRQFFEITRGALATQTNTPTKHATRWSPDALYCSRDVTSRGRLFVSRAVHFQWATFNLLLWFFRPELKS